MADAGPLDLCEAEQSELARRYVLTSELYVEEPWSHAGPRSVSPFAPCAASRLPHVFDAARLTGDSVLWDLGCGDGRILHEAAARYGCRCVGVEIDAPCLDMCKEGASRLGADVDDRCSWFLRDMTSMPSGSLGTDDSLGPDVPAPSVLLLFITGHGLKAMSPWLKREWEEAPTPFAIVTCVEALDSCIDYNDGVPFDDADANPDGWRVYRDPVHAKYGVFVVPPRDIGVHQWASSRPSAVDCGPDAVASHAPAIARGVLREADIRAVEKLAARLNARRGGADGRDEKDGKDGKDDKDDDDDDDDDASGEALAMRLSNAMGEGGDDAWSEVEDAYHSLKTHRVTHLHAGDALATEAPVVRARLLRAAFDADAGRCESGGGWGLLPGRPVFLRSAEYHDYSRGGGVTEENHRDQGSVLTVSVHLEVSDDGGGGVFATWDGDGTRTEFRDLRRGDAVIFCSEKRHGVSPLVADAAVRKSVVLELWERGVTKHNRQR